MKKIILAAPIIALCFGAPSPLVEAAPVKKYDNCAALNKDYPNGVRKDDKAQDMFVNPKTKKKEYKSTKATVSKEQYEKNKGLDRDKDNIACEKQ